MQSYFNKIDFIKDEEVEMSSFEFSISTLYTWIRFFECLLHLGHKPGIRNWQAHFQDDKQITANQKATIQKGLKQGVGLIIDSTKPEYGNTNNGYTARRFFEYFSVSAEILGVDEPLTKRFHIILQVIPSSFVVLIGRVRQYCCKNIC